MPNADRALHKRSLPKRLWDRTHPWFVGWIVVMWCLLMGEVTWANLLGGLGVALLVVLALPLPAIPQEEAKVRWGSLLAYAGEWFIQLMRASVKVAYLAMRPYPPPPTAIVQVPMRVSSDLVLSFATAAYNLQPGGTVTDIDIANRLWTVHLLDARDDAAIEREIATIAQLEHRMIHIFETRR